MSRRQMLATGAAAMGGLILPGAVAGQTPTPQGDGTGGIRMSEGLLPDNRLLFYYGFPENELMGILGEYSPEECLSRMREQAAEYEAADNSRPWKLGFELIASVAQGFPQEDNSYVADTDGKWLDLYTEFTAANDMVLMLDVQMGRKTPKEDYAGLERWLQYDHVHHGIDPEFKMWGDGVPGKVIGHVTGEQVTEAQTWLVDLANRYGTSRKTLVVHQFTLDMIEGKESIAPVDGVDLVIDMDGWGNPEHKLATWQAVIQGSEIEYNGIKLFYGQDDPLMSAADVMGLTPTPDVVIYQ
jgi:hypothetical protein